MERLWSNTLFTLFFLIFTTGCTDAVLDFANQSSGGGTGANLDISPVYPKLALWGDYVIVADSNAAAYAQPEVECTAGYISALGVPKLKPCVHAGQYRKIEVTDQNHCGSFSASDEAGVFDWVCSESSGYAIFYNSGFKTGKGLKHLLQDSGFKPLVVTISDGQKSYYATAKTPWGNTVKNINEVFGSSTKFTLDGEGTVYIFASDYEDAVGKAFHVVADKVSLVTLEGASITTSVTEKDNMILLEKSGEDNYFNWLEIDFNYNGTLGSNKNLVSLLRFQMSRVHLSDISYTGTAGSGNSLFKVDNSKYNQFTQLTLTGGNKGLNLNLSDYNTIDKITPQNQNEDSILVNNSKFNEISYVNGGSDGSGHGIRLYNLSTNNSVKHITLEYYNEGIDVNGLGASDPSNNTFYDITTYGSADFGVGVSEGSNNNSFNKIRSAHNTTSAVRIVNADHNYFYDVIVGFSAGTSSGILLKSSSSNNFVNFKSSNNGGHGLEVLGYGSDNSNSNIFVSGLLVNNNKNGVYSDGDTTPNSWNHYSHITASNNQLIGMELTDAHQSSINQALVLANGTHGVFLGSSAASNNLSQIVAYGHATKDFNNSGNGVNDLQPNTHVIFGTGAYMTFSGSVTSQENRTEASAIDSANKALNLFVPNSIGQVSYTADIVGGTAWFSLEDTNWFNTYKDKDASSEYACLSSVCDVQGFQLNSGASVPIFVNSSLFKPAGTLAKDLNTNESRIDFTGGDCTAEMQQTAEYQISGGSVTYIANAREILGKTGGNNNGICEIGEYCLFSPNYGGADQGSFAYDNSAYCQADIDNDMDGDTIIYQPKSLNPGQEPTQADLDLGGNVAITH